MAKRKVKINKLPKGYSLSNGKLTKDSEQYKFGGKFSTGDQYNYGMVKFPQFMNGSENDNEIPFFPSAGKVQNTLGPDKRDEANIEAEKGETTLTDLNNDGVFELYNIGGKRHFEGGTPLNLPEQSFIYSDTRSMKLNKEEMEEMNVLENKKRTPAFVSKKFPLNRYSEILNDPASDKIAVDTAEYMLDKNKRKLSHLAFIQEAKKKFDEGVPNAAFPFLKEQGVDPIQYSKMMEMVNKKEEHAIKALGKDPSGKEKMELLGQFIAKANDPKNQKSQQPIPPMGGGMPPMGPPQGPPPMAPPQQEMMAQGPPPNMMAPQGPPQGMMPPQDAPVQQEAPMQIVKRGGSVRRFDDGGYVDYDDTPMHESDFFNFWGAFTNPNFGQPGFQTGVRGMTSKPVLDESGNLVYSGNMVEGWWPQMTMTAFEDPEVAEWRDQPVYSEGRDYYQGEEFSPRAHTGYYNYLEDFFTDDSNKGKDKLSFEEFLKQNNLSADLLDKSKLAALHAWNMKDPRYTGPRRESGQFKYGGRFDDGGVITDFETNWTSDRNQDLRNAFYVHYAEQLGIDADDLSDVQKQEIDALLIKDTKMKSLMHEHFDADYFTGEEWDNTKGDNKNKKYFEAVQKLIDDGHWEGTALTEEEIKKVQNAHISLNTMSRMDEYEDLFKGQNMNLSIAGPEESGNVGANSQLSNADGIAGDNFIQSFVSSSYTPQADKEYEWNLNPDGEFEPKMPEYWKQDNMKLMGAIMDKFSIKKHMPTLSKYKETLIDPAYISPTQQFAKISEMTSQAADTAKAFAGPKRSASVMSKAQGEGMSQLATVQAETDNKNLQIFSDTQAKNAMISNEFETLNKKAMSDYADKVNLVNENYENAVRVANNNVMNQAVQRETNRANTFNTNQLYEQFNIHPEHAGAIYLTDPKEFYADKTEDTSNYDEKVKRIEDMIDKGWIDKKQANELMQDLVNTDLPNQSTKNKHQSDYAGILNTGYPGGPPNINPSMNQNYMNNPMMMQYLMQQQANPYAQQGARGIEVPSFPFGMPRRKRKLRTFE